ncbi:hypothetical protein ACWD4P_28020 [Kitasatospora sp. NPDC002543]
MSAKSRLVSVLAAATVVLGAAAGLADLAGNTAADRSATAVAADQAPAAGAAGPTTAAAAGTGHGTASTEDMGWQW